MFGCSRKRTSLRKESGSVMVEAAVTMQVFATLLFVGIGLTVGAYRYVSLQFAVSEAARWAVLGKTTTLPNGTVLSRKHSIENKVVEVGKTFGLRLAQGYAAGTNHPRIRICDEDNYACADGDAPGAEDPGNKNQFVQIVARDTINLGLFNFTFRAAAIGKNEPF